MRPAFVLSLLTILTLSHRASAVEWPSFLRAGDAFCTSEADYDDYASHGHVRPDSAMETCQTIRLPTRVAVMAGRGGVKTMVMVMNGPNAYIIGWTNGVLPLAK